MNKFLLLASLMLASFSVYAQEVTVNANDQMQFDVKEIKVKAGEEIKLTLNHTGKLAKAAMGHNIVVLVPGTDAAAFGQAAMQAKDNDYIPADSEQVIAHTKVIGGGESDSISFTLEAGTYEFICSFPGHWAVMKGKIIVE